jgi:DNA-binding NtrC family response regulator
MALGQQHQRERRSRVRHGRRERRRMFIVEDDPGMLRLLSDIAQDAGWESHGFTHISSLRRALARERPAMMIIDDDLPDGRGGDLARQLRRELPDVTLVVCTAAPSMRRAEIGAWVPVLPKPIDLGAMERIMERAAAV